MLLSKLNLKKMDAGNVSVFDESLFSLPEKVLQFGTGVLLRGLPDYFIDKANKKSSNPVGIGKSKTIRIPIIAEARARCE